MIAARTVDAWIDSRGLRRHGMDVVVVLLALAGALDVVLRHDARAPRSPLWFSRARRGAPGAGAAGAPAVPFGAPAAVWVGAAAVSFVDGRLIVFAAGR